MSAVNRKDRVKRAVIYTRVSTGEQVENFSLETQEAACREFCERNGFVVDRLFREEGRSAKTLARPRLDEMIAHCSRRENVVDAVVVYKVDRLTRNVHDHQVVRGLLRSRGIRVYSVMEAYDDTPAGGLIENLMGVLAEFDNRMRGERTKDGMGRPLGHGRWVWGPPLGYVKGVRSPGPSILVDAASAPLIRVAFEMVGSGRSKKEALDHVTVLGLQTRRGLPLTQQSFGAMLRNPLYQGLIDHPGWGVRTEGDFEAIVSAELFQLVQDVLDGRRGATDRRKRDREDFPLRRFVRCASCSAPLTGSWSRGRNRRYRYYRCPRKGCGRASVRGEVLDRLFLERLHMLSARAPVFALLAATIRDLAGEREQQTATARQKAHEAVRSLARRRDRLVDAFVHEGKIDRATYEAQSARLNEEEDRLRPLLTEGRGSIDIDAALSFGDRLMRDLAGCWNRLTVAQRPAFLRSLYPNGLSFDGEAFGTGQTSWLFEQCEPEKAADGDWVLPTGFEPVSPP